MKIEKMGLNLNKNEVKKERNAKNNVAMSKFSLPKMQKGNLRKDVVSFGSPVVSKDIIKHQSHPIFLNRLAKFIDKFEEKTKYNKKASVNSNVMSSEYLGHGMSGSAHLLYDGLHAVDQDVLDYINVDYHFIKNIFLAINDGYTKFVIKETQKSNPKDLENEFEELKKVVDMPNMQQGIALMKTRDGGTFLISEFAHGTPKGKVKNNGVKEFNRMTRNELTNTLSLLDTLNKKGLFNPDLNLGNILYSSETPTIIDLEWQTSLNRAGEMFVFANNEKKSNMISYEGTGLCGYIKDLYSSTIEKESYNRARQECRNFLRTYFVERAQYCDTSNRLERVRKAVYQNPTDDVIDAEILRLSILKNHEKQYTYVDKNTERPQDMLEMVRYQARANFSAKMLSEFQPQRPYSETSRAEDEYFEEMRKFGKDWHNKTKDWYKGSINWMKRLVTGEEYQSAQSGYSYFPHLFGTGVDSYRNPRLLTVPDKTKLSDVLSNGTKSKWDDVMEDDDDEDKIGLKTRVIKLEAAFVNLKTAIDTNNTQLRVKAEKSINILTGKVLQ